MNFIENFVGSDKKQLQAIRDILAEILEVSIEILNEIKGPEVPVEVKIFQLDKKGARMSLLGVTSGDGVQHVFEADGLSASGAAASYPSGTQFIWSVSDQLVSLGPDSGPNGNQVTATDAAGDTAATFPLTVTVQMPAVGGVLPAVQTVTVNVPITPGVTPPPAGPVSVAINQIS